MADGAVFSRLMEEHGGFDKQAEVEGAEPLSFKRNVDSETEDVIKDGKALEPSALMQDEERLTGAVTWSVYAKFFRFAGGFSVAAVILLWVILSQAAQGP